MSFSTVGFVTCSHFEIMVYKRQIAQLPIILADADEHIVAIGPVAYLAQFKGRMAYIAETGWTVKAFIAASTTGLDMVLLVHKTSIEGTAAMTAMTANEIRNSADWISQLKESWARGRAKFTYEKEFIWSNDNCRTNGAYVSAALMDGTSSSLAAGACAWAVTKKDTRVDQTRTRAVPQSISTRC